MEKDPNGINQHQAGAKLDAGKPDASLLLMFGRALTEVARVGTFGANKYSRGGWQFVPNGIERYTAALLRHLLAENKSIYDAESGLRHAAQVAWNSLARLELMLREEEKNEQQGISDSVCAPGQAVPLPAGKPIPVWGGLPSLAVAAGQGGKHLEGSGLGPSAYLYLGPHGG